MSKENQEHKFENVPLAKIEAVARQAAADGDDREEVTVDWGKLKPDPVRKLTEDSFSEYVGQSFEIEHEGRKVKAKLATAKTSPASPSSPGTDPRVRLPEPSAGRGVQGR